jgi:hypothetical protein
VRPEDFEVLAECRRWMGHGDDCRSQEDGPDTCDCGSDKARFKAMALLLEQEKRAHWGPIIREMVEHHERLDVARAEALSKKP